MLGPVSNWMGQLNHLCMYMTSYLCELSLLPFMDDKMNISCQFTWIWGWGWLAWFKGHPALVLHSSNGPGELSE